MKSLQPTEAGIHNLFSVRYRRLVDENNHNNINNNNNHHHHNNNNNAQLVMQNLIRMKLSQDYIAYCCGQCGHHQRLDIKVKPYPCFTIFIFFFLFLPFRLEHARKKNGVSALTIANCFHPQKWTVRKMVMVWLVLISEGNLEKWMCV